MTRSGKAKSTTKSRTLRPTSSALAIMRRLPADIRPYPGNPRTHTQRQVAAIARGIATVGFLNPILIDERCEILAGHGRHEAARLAGLEQVPTIMISHLSTVQKKAYRIADNRLAEAGSAWSFELLQSEVDGILQLDADFDLTLTGFDLRDLELKLDNAAADHDDDGEDEAPVPASAAVSEIGDIWRVGEHRVLCGDATEEAAYRLLLGRERPDMVFTDPPYGVRIAGNVSGLGKHKHREFVQGSGEMSDTEFQQFLLAFMLHCARFARSGALHYIFMDWRHMRHLLLAGLAAYDEQLNLCVWAKCNGGMGSLYRSQHELVAVFKKGKAPHTNNVELGANGRNRTNVWSVAGMNTPSAERDEALAMHPTVKPLALVRDAILDVTRRGDIVLDPFGGSGTTLIAAAKVGRVARLIELDPLYVDVILRRATRTLGMTPVLAETGETFDAVAVRRKVVAHG